MYPLRRILSSPTRTSRLGCTFNTNQQKSRNSNSKTTTKKPASTPKTPEYAGLAHPAQSGPVRAPKSARRPKQSRPTFRVTPRRAYSVCLAMIASVPGMNAWHMWKEKTKPSARNVVKKAMRAKQHTDSGASPYMRQRMEAEKSKIKG
ncbi:uncharacterized protein BKA78DRAFT_295068 [Phyllosticta capitalensis]|uniref:uncharacterized protein n=1 Tax=Phyllosticta capitalensis TaxID=121624 RepID=UPI0031310269